MYIIISKHKFSNAIDVTKEHYFTIKTVYKNIPNQQFYTTIIVNTDSMKYTTNGMNWKDIENEI